MKESGEGEGRKESGEGDGRKEREGRRGDNLSCTWHMCISSTTGVCVCVCVGGGGGGTESRVKTKFSQVLTFSGYTGFQGYGNFDKFCASKHKTETNSPNFPRLNHKSLLILPAKNQPRNFEQLARLEYNIPKSFPTYFFGLWGGTTLGTRLTLLRTSMVKNKKYNISSQSKEHTSRTCS